VLLYAGAVLLLGAEDIELLLSVLDLDVVPEYVEPASLLGLLVLYEGLVLILGLL